MEHMKTFGFEADKKIVGMCTIGRVEGLSKNCSPFAVIENVVVESSMRRGGIGTQFRLSRNPDYRAKRELQPLLLAHVRYSIGEGTEDSLYPRHTNGRNNTIKD